MKRCYLAVLHQLFSQVFREMLHPPELIDQVIFDVFLHLFVGQLGGFPLPRCHGRNFHERGSQIESVLFLSCCFWWDFFERGEIWLVGSNPSFFDLELSLEFVLPRTFVGLPLCLIYFSESFLFSPELLGAECTFHVLGSVDNELLARMLKSGVSESVESFCEYLDESRLPSL